MHLGGRALICVVGCAGVGRVEIVESQFMRPEDAGVRYERQSCETAAEGVVESMSPATVDA